MTKSATLAGNPASRAAMRPPRPPREVSPFEFWPGWIFYAPVILQWIALGLRHGDMSLPTAANPAIETGGLCGESKGAVLDLLTGPARDWVAPYTRIDSRADRAVVNGAIERAGLSFPLILKPDIGCNGTGVRLVHDLDGLLRGLPDYPAGIQMVLQRFIAWEGEAGLFYIRHPHEAHGRITSVTLKEAPYVVGDGRATLRELVLRDPRAGLVPHLYLPRLAGRLEEVPAQGVPVRLVLVGNHCKGSIFHDGAEHLTQALTERIDMMARAMPEFYFGRFDVRFASLPALHRGEDFAVIEVNGVGSEATHVWDARTTLRKAWTDELRHFSAAWKIGHANRARGHKPSGLRPMYQAWMLQRRLMAAYPVSD